MTATAATTAAGITASIRGLLLLHKEHDVPHNVLAMVGLFTVDFPSTPALIWDHEGFVAQTKKFRGVCTCAEHPKDERTEVVQGDKERHGHRCHLAQAQVLFLHPQLTEVTDDEDTMEWTFQWPRDIQPYRTTIGTRFPVAQDDDLWPNFRASWLKIAEQMPEAEFSLAEKTGLTPIQGEDWTPVEEDAKGFDLNFDELPAVEHNKDIPTLSKDQQTSMTEEQAENIMPLAVAELQAPAPPEETSKRGPGRPKGSSKAAKEAKKELRAGDFAPEVQEGGKKVFPAILKFAQMAREEMELISHMIGRLQESEDFPVNEVRALKVALDRLALRTAHLEYRGAHDTDDPKAMNPLLEISLANITACANTAVRDLGLAPEIPKSWEDYAKAIKESVDLSKSVLEVMSQMGAGPAIQEIPSVKP